MITRVAALVVVCFAWCGTAAAAPGVLVFYGDERVTPAQVEYDAAIREALGLPGADIEYSAEFLDTVRFAEPEAGPRWRDFIKGKYHGHDVRVVVAAGVAALEFMLHYKPELFPTQPLIVAAVPASGLHGRTLPPNTLVLPTIFDFLGTIRVAQRLQPAATEVVVVVGTTPTDLAWGAMAEREVAPPKGPLPMRFLRDLSMDEIRRELSALTLSSIVLIMPFNRDALGRTFIPALANAAMNVASGAPTYSIFSVLTGTGEVGGQKTTFTQLGHWTGEVVGRLLGGASMAEVAAVPIPRSRFVVDWRQMQRWRLDEARLPADTEVRFRPLTAWQQYPGTIVAVSSLLVLQAMSLVALLVQRRRRDLAEVQVHRHRNDLAHLTRVSLMGELSSSLAHELNQPLTAILSNTQAAQNFLQAPQPDLGIVREILADIAADDRRAGEVIRRQRELLKKGEPRLQTLRCRELVESVLAVARGDLLGREVSVTTDLPGDLPSIQGDHVQLQQVLLNLIMNAADAMRDLPTAERRVAIAAARGMGATIDVTVGDRGHGVSADQLAKMFEPFFTTKAEGLGMGLSISRTLVEAHGGRLWATANADRGVTLHLTLPTAARTD